MVDFSKPRKPSRASLFLASGGAKGITAQCVTKLAQCYQSTFILMGRSPYSAEPEPNWSAGVPDEKALKQQAMDTLTTAGEHPTPKRIQRMVKDILSQREIAATLRAIEGAGGHAIYVNADVTDAAAAHAGVEQARQQLGAEGDGTLPQITGIIHGAGVIADRPIAQKTEADFELVYSVKVDGLKNLLHCVPPGDLEHLILFSSVAGFYGNVGQTDYALANEILNKVAYQFKREHPACRVLAIDWGPWDGGMVTPALKRLLAQRDIDVIPVDTGREIFASAVATDDGDTQLVVGNALARPAQVLDNRVQTHRMQTEPIRIHRQLSLDANPFLQDHVIGGQAVLPTVCAVAWVVNAAEQCYPGYTFFRVENYKALKGIVFDGTLADDYVLEIKEMDADCASPKGSGQPEQFTEVTLIALICSQSDDGKSRYHYSMDVTLRRTPPASPQYTGFDLAVTHPITREELYGGTILFHGPSFQGVKQILNLGPGSLTMQCTLPELSPETQGQFPVQTFNPYLTDTSLQSLLVWAHHTYGYGGLPLSIQKGEQYRSAKVGDKLYASLHVQSSSKRRLLANVILHDADGQVYSHVTGAEITLSPRLNPLFAQNQLPTRSVRRGQQ